MVRILGEKIAVTDREVIRTSHGLDESSVMEKEDFLDFWDFSKVVVAKITFF